MQLVTVTDNDCEALFDQQATHWQGDSIGIEGIMPVTVAARALYQEASPGELRGANQPLWAQQRIEQDHFHGLLYVDAGLPVFSGHFPGNPILPGVILIHWSITSAADTFEQTPKTAFAGMSRIKFKSPVKPGAWLKLQLTRSDSSVRFVFADNQGACTEGRLQYHG